MRGLAAVLAALALAVVALGCGGDGEGERPPGGDRAAQESPGGGAEEPAERRRSVEPARCPAGVPDCRSATGRIVYVERVDPDGDGDAHFVILDSQGISLPGLTAIDVRPGLRPRPLPGPGEVISAAGPVQTGSFGQSQIHALRLNVAGRD